MAEPKLTVVIPTFNRSAQVRVAVESVLTEAGDDVEVLVVNDGSTDETLRVLRSVDDARFRVITQVNGGVCAARTRGASEARSDFVTFLDDDDRPLVGWSGFFIGARERGADLASCGARLAWSGTGRESVRAPSSHGPEFGHLDALFLAGAFAIDRRLLDAVGGFKAGLRYSEHTHLALRLGTRNLEARIATDTCARPLVALMRRAGAGPSDQVRFDSAVAILDDCGEGLARSPRLLSTYQAIAGVSAAKIGRVDEARRLLRRAARSYPPRAGRNLARLARTYLPDKGVR